MEIYQSVKYICVPVEYNAHEFLKSYRITTRYHCHHNRQSPAPHLQFKNAKKKKIIICS